MTIPIFRRGAIETTLLTVNETAAFLGVSTRTIRRMIRRKDLDVARFGRTVRVDAQSLGSRDERAVPAAGR